MDICLSVDVEVWCDSWRDLDRQFPQAFKRYVYGQTRGGDFGLPFMLRMLRDHGLKATFFTEPLFATRFGLQPLAEIVGLIRDGGQDVQLHLHTEWVDESPIPLLPGAPKGKRQHLRQYSLAEQTALIAKGIELITAAGAARPTVFRAGNFGFNRDTIRAVRANALSADSSYNATMFGPTSGLSDELLYLPVAIDGVFEFPVTCYRDGMGRLRHMQIGACSFGEMSQAINRAAAANWETLVLFLHNFEFLDDMRWRPDWVTIRRFERLCAMLDNQRDELVCQTFTDIKSPSRREQPAPLRCSPRHLISRTASQARRRLSRLMTSALWGRRRLGDEAGTL